MYHMMLALLRSYFYRLNISTDSKNLKISAVPQNYSGVCINLRSFLSAKLVTSLAKIEVDCITPFFGDFSLISIFLFYNNELVRARIRRILEDIKGIKVVGEAQRGENAVREYRGNTVDIVLMDMNIPGIDGLKTAHKVVYYMPGAKVITLTAHSKNPLPAKVMQAGSSGYLSKGLLP